MIKHVEGKKISSLFYEEMRFKIPKYQRAYTWGKREWNQLFNDITENSEGYFLGSIICVNDARKDSHEYELIDGQQRLTTLSIMLLTIYNRLKQLKDNFLEDEDLLTDYNNIRRELHITDKSKNKFPRLELQTTASNKADFESILSENGIEVTIEQKPKYRGLRNIDKAYTFFGKCLDDYVSENISKGNQPYEVLFEIASKFNAAILVDIEVESHKDAFMLFESLNNRGVPLTAIDLLKNIIIRESEADNATDEIYNKWECILSNLGDDYSSRERFFRQYYNAFREELNEPYRGRSNLKYELGYLATRTTLLDIYERLIEDNGYKPFVNDLLKYSKIYSVIINNSSEKYVFTDSLKDLANIQGAPSYLLLLYLIDQKNKLSIDDNQINEIILFLIKFFVRRNITDNPNTRNLVKIFMDIILEIRCKKNKDVVKTIKTKLMEVSSLDSLFEEKLRGQIYQENDMATRFILCQIESKNQTKEIYSDLWKRDDKGRYVWTIEHIFPEGDNIPKEWVDMIADGDIAKAKEYLEMYTHKLGNLTLTGYNSNLSNLSFDKKKERTNKDKKPIGYRNGLYLNCDVVNKTSWKVINIEERTDRLVKIALDLFKLTE